MVTTWRLLILLRVKKNRNAERCEDIMWVVPLEMLPSRSRSSVVVIWIVGSERKENKKEQILEWNKNKG